MNKGVCWIVWLVLLFSFLPVMAQNDELCIDGTLLFLEDFGGNDPNDPDVSTATVPGMDPSYYNSGNSLGTGHYTIRKEGWQNGVQWHRQDDHTYFGDKTRGYLLEIDGKGGAKPFYSKTIDGLCAGSRLTFSAYVVNVHYAGQIQWFYDRGREYVYPRLKFVLKDPSTGETLASKSTGDIQPDWSQDWATARANSASAEWQLVGMNFTVPEGVQSIQMFIYNDVAQNGSGNDFALDDIEIHICLPKPVITSDSVACADSSYVFTIDFTNDGTLAEPLEYQWFYSSDSLQWNEVTGATMREWSYTALPAAATGWYKVAIAGAGNIQSPNCRTVSEPFHLRTTTCDPPAPVLCMNGTLLFREDFGGNDPNDPRVSSTPVPGMSNAYQQVAFLEPRGGINYMGAGKYLVAKRGYRNSTLANYSVWHIMDDHTHFGDTTRGYFLEIDGRGGSDAFYKTSIGSLCPGAQLTFSAYIANITTAGQYVTWKNQGRACAYPKITFVLSDSRTGTELARYNTDTIGYDWSNYPKSWRETAEWQLVGMNFTVPEGIDSIELRITNNVSSSNGNDFALDDIEIRLCLPPVEITSPHEVCENAPYAFVADFTNDGTLAEPLEYQWYFSADSLNWQAVEGATISNWQIKKAKAIHTGWYKLAVAGAGNINKENCRAMSEPFRFDVKTDCYPPILDLCTDGKLLFREDFGGNDPNDPRVGAQPVNGMTYNQLLDDYFGIMRSGSYLVTKSGYCNGDTLPSNPYRGSQWHLQDDHTYPGDKTRGYLLEIDGRGDNVAFYNKTIDGLCTGIELTFSAYVANVMTWGQYEGRPGMYAYPRLKFVLTNPVDNSELSSYDTGNIPYDSAFVGDYTCWQYSSVWRLVGMTFVVPEGVEAVKLTIYNNVTSYTGNDFAIDDIEIRLCMPAPTIVSDNEACLDSAYTFAVNFTNDGTLAEPLEYKWWYSADSLTWTEKPGLIGASPSISAVQRTDSGWYKVAVSGVGNIESPNCRALSEPFLLNPVHCQGPITYVTRDTTVCDTLMPYTWHELTFSTPGSQTTIQKDQWGFDSLHTTWTLSTELCCPELLILRFDTLICDTLLPFEWPGYYGEWYRPGSEQFTWKSPRGCDSVLLIYQLDTFHCERPCPELLVQHMDTTVCDTLMPFSWRGMLFDNLSEKRVMEQSPRGCDSIEYIYTLDTVHCEPPCPDIRIITTDTTVCDTLLPFEWRSFVFAEPSEQFVMEQSPRGCDSIKYVYRLDTVHCDRWYNIIVNKYNWQLLCNNVALQRYFPNRQVLEFQWFKDNTAVPGANEDDYSEQNELHGVFQLRVTLDGHQVVWSNILEIGESQEVQPVNVRIYNSQGVPVSEERMTRGVYLYRYEQGELVWTEKKVRL